LKSPFALYDERQAYTAETISTLQSACASGADADFDRYLDAVRGQEPAQLRDLLDFRSPRRKLPLAQVEPVNARDPSGLVQECRPPSLCEDEIIKYGQRLPALPCVCWLPFNALQRHETQSWTRVLNLRNEIIQELFKL